MRPDGRVVAMVGGRDYAKSAFNRATQARRQPGSTFKLFVYLAAMRAGMTPSSTVDDTRVDIAGWKPRNDDGRYLGEISLARAFARSSNVAAARLTQQVGVRNVIKAARDLGISTPIPEEATIGLGTAEVSLLELTSAYAAISAGRYPVQPRGVEKPTEDKGWLQSLTGGTREMPDEIRQNMLSLLNSSIRGTGREAVLSVTGYGKTGTSQDSRDAWFIGFAGDLVVGVWVGNDDNSANPGLHGGTVPARIWRSFMQAGLGLAVPAQPVMVEEVDPDGALQNITEDGVLPGEGTLRGLGIEMKLDRDGSFSVAPAPEEEPPPRDDRRAEEEPVDEGF
jgi:penicillin-binding protein 1A